MNSRQRFREVMAYGRADRVPYFTEGIRKKVIQTWMNQGLDSEESLSEQFPMDQRVEIAPELLVQPDLKNWPATLSELNGFSQGLDPDDPQRLPADWPAPARDWEKSGNALILRAHRGLYQTLGVAGWRRFAEVNLLFKDEPVMVRKMLEIQAQCAATLLERVLSEVKVDAALFSEPISGNSRPLVSPEMFGELIDISYEPLLAVFRKYEVDTLIVRTYANARILLPVLLDRGFNCLWACEVPPGTMDYEDIRREYGKELRLIGGIDVDVLREDEAAIREELMQKVPPLLEDGGFIPLADGRVRAVVPYKNYVYYRKLLSEIVENAH